MHPKGSHTLRDSLGSTLPSAKMSLPKQHCDGDQVLEDAVVKKVGEKSKQQQRTAAAHFSDFLRLHGDDAISGFTIGAIPAEHVTAELLGRFGTFLSMKANKLSAAHSYISQVKGYFSRNGSATPSGSSTRTIPLISGTPTCGLASKRCSSRRQ